MCRKSIIIAVRKSFLKTLLPFLSKPCPRFFSAQKQNLYLIMIDMTAPIS